MTLAATHAPSADSYELPPPLSLVEGSFRREGCRGFPSLPDEEVDAFDFHVCDFIGADGLRRMQYLAAQKYTRMGNRQFATALLCPDPRLPSVVGNMAYEQLRQNPDAVLHLAPPMFYVEPGRFQDGTRAALKRQGWAQLFWCQRGQKQRAEFDMVAMYSHVLEFAWIKNRSNFPFLDVVFQPSPDKLATQCSFSHIPTEFELTKKDRLAANTARYNRFLNSHGLYFEFHDLAFPVHPETYRLKDWRECQRFIATVKKRKHQWRKLRKQSGLPDSAVDPQNVWIIKPSKGSCGRGISVHSDIDNFIDNFHRLEQESPEARRKRDSQLRSGEADDFLMTSRIAQRYIARPLLIEGKKFDVRSYLYIVDVADQVVYYHDGYIRKNAELYDSDLTDLSNRFIHLSNVSVQKKHPDFAVIQEEMRWRYDRFQAYLTEHNLAPDDWVEKTFRPTMKLMMWFAFKSALHRMNKTSGFYSMVGADFIVDSELNIQLIEFSKTPAVHKSKTGNFTQQYTNIIQQAVEMHVEVRRRQIRGESFAPGNPLNLVSARTWESCRPQLQSSSFAATLPPFIPTAETE